MIRKSRMIHQKINIEGVVSLNPALKDFWEKQADTKILKGGRGGSKTYDTAGRAILLARKYGLKFLCLRQVQNKIPDSVYSVLIDRIEYFGLSSEFYVTKTNIIHKKTGASFHFLGFERNTAQIKGFHDADICWIEEAEGLTKDQHAIIDPTLRAEGAEVWIVYNPRLVSDFVETFVTDPEERVLVRHINYDENPFLTDTMIRKIERMRKNDPELFQNIYLGIPLSDDDLVLIKRSWIEASIDAHIKLGIEPAGTRAIGFDVADSGKDLCSQIYRHGIVNLWGEHWKGKEDEILKSCKRVYSKAIELGSEVIYDNIGVGSFCGSKFDEINKERLEQGDGKSVSYSGFNAGGKVSDPDGLYIDAEEESITNAEFFHNAKAQEWWKIANRFRNTYNAVTHGEEFDEEDLISISSDMPNLANLVTELSTPQRDYAIGGKVKVESKKDLAKREIASPNDADAFIMANSNISDKMNFAKLLELSMG